MKLDQPFSGLRELIQAHGLTPVEFDTCFIPKPYKPVDDEIPSDGLTVKLKDVSSRGGILSYHNRQVLLYMQKHHGPGRFEKAIAGIHANKFHLCECEHLRKEREKNREDNYVITEDLSGIFFICGDKDTQTGRIPDARIELKVCKMCLEALNYKGYKTSSQRREVFNEFNLADFFCDYGSLFNKENKRIAGNKYEEGYSSDWKDISISLRDQAKWQCRECQVNFGRRTGLLHVHHVNGAKRDNRKCNLKVLCIDCHKKQPNHAHMHLKHADAKAINLLRRHQNLLSNLDWNNIKTYADTCLYGFLDLCKENHIPSPEVAYLVDNVYFDLAWPQINVGIAIDTEQSGLHGLRNRTGWYALGIDSEFKNMESFILRLSQHFQKSRLDN